MQKLGKNQNGYFGQTIDVRRVLNEIESVSRHLGWKRDVFHSVKDFDLVALHRQNRQTQEPGKIYISAGIHGDEPAGPLAALRLLSEDRWPANAEIFLLPCLNPVGFTLNRRENEQGRDLNRDYRNSVSGEIRAHVAWLERQPGFDLYLCLHEDWESHGFYLYEQNPDRKISRAEQIIAAVEKVCPVDQSEMIEGRPAQHGIIRPNILPHERPDWPEAFYLITHKSRQGYTLEAPSDFPLPTRVNALVAAVHAALAG